ncbi:unnamed protein product [Menidia menidia]|uniref:(Atlantic silverside) hypothetical protein n=1 Tax=Menidia menidia TaxID=238744 RepID=A0A8S4B703_9TELE|nr:unnamed protein product [Menidia menidia]
MFSPTCTVRACTWGDPSTFGALTSITWRLYDILPLEALQTWWTFVALQTWWTFVLVDQFQVLVAANKAFHLQTVGKLKTRSLNSEIIFNLSPTNNISEAFRRFGASEGDGAVLVVVVHDKDQVQVPSEIRARVDGRQVPVEEISSLSDPAAIRKV